MTAAMYSSLYIYLILSRLPHAILPHHCNFQDFVSMMKQELSAQTGFSMPERYYQVSREESNDGRFYSKISAIDWDDL